MKYIIVSFVLASILAASVLKTMNFIDWSWSSILSPVLLWLAYEVLVLIIILLVYFFKYKKKGKIYERAVPKSGFMKRLEGAQRVQREELNKRLQSKNS